LPFILFGFVSFGLGGGGYAVVAYFPLWGIWSGRFVRLPNKSGGNSLQNVWLQGVRFPLFSSVLSAGGFAIESD
jgi:hypothetical protein